MRSDNASGGELQPGDQLPSQRELAKELVINHLTVKRAYETLEAAGLIGTERGRGTFVRSGGDVRTRAAELETLRQTFAQALQQLRAAGLEKPEAHGLIDEFWHQTKNKKQKSEK